MSQASLVANYKNNVVIPKILNKTLPESISLQDETDCFTMLADLTVPDGILTGLGLSLSGQNVLIAPGTWKIDGINYATLVTGSLPIDAQDATYSRYDVLYVDDNNHINLISGALSLTPFEPAVPDSTIKIGSILITPTVVTLNNPNLANLVNTTSNQNVGGIKTFTDGILAITMPMGDSSLNLATTEYVQKELLEDLVVFNSLGFSGAGTNYDPYLLNAYNGLTVDNTGLYLGGSLAGNITIAGGDNYFIKLTSTYAGFNIVSTLSTNNGVNTLLTQNTNLSTSASILTGFDDQHNPYSGFQYFDGANLQRITTKTRSGFFGTGTGILVTDSIDTKGLYYAADYSAHFVDRSLIDKGYADAHYGTGSGTVTTVSVVTANGVSGSVATATTTPAITITLGAITPTTINKIPYGSGGGGVTTNVAAGFSALTNNSTGVSNTAIGNNALFNLSSGSDNTAIGAGAGQYINDLNNPNSTSNNSVFVGYQSAANASGQTNQIVIGYQALGNGSNTVTLGNTSITSTYLKGNILLNTTPTTSAGSYSVLTYNPSTGVIEKIDSSGTYLPLAGGTLTGNINLAGDATTALQPITYGQFINWNNGFSWKHSVIASTTATLPSYTTSGSFLVLTATANGALPAQDGVTLVLNDNLLVKNESGGLRTNNGGYTLTQVGDGSHPWILTRMTDSASSAQLQSATYKVREGSAQSFQVYTVNVDPVVLGTTQITFALTGGAGTYLADGVGISLSGNTFSAIPSYYIGLISATAPIVYNNTTGVISAQVANTSQSGVISSTDWNTFNNKLSTSTAASTYVPYTGATGNVTLGTNTLQTGVLGINTGVTAVTTKLQVVETSSSTIRGAVFDQYSTDTSGSKFYERKSRGTLASPTTIVTGDAIASHTFSAYDGTQFTDAAKILVTSTGTLGTGIIPATMSFQTANSGGALTTALLIDSSQTSTFSGLTVINSNVAVSGSTQAGLTVQSTVASGSGATGQNGGVFVGLTTPGSIASVDQSDALLIANYSGVGGAGGGTINLAKGIEVGFHNITNNTTVTVNHSIEFVAPTVASGSSIGTHAYIYAPSTALTRVTTGYFIQSLSTAQSLLSGTLTVSGGDIATSNATSIIAKGYNLGTSSSPLGDYGYLLLNSNANFTGNARPVAITNAYNGNAFAIAIGTGATTPPVFNSSGAITTGTIGLSMDRNGNVTVPTGSFTANAGLYTSGNFSLAATGNNTAVSATGQNFNTAAATYTDNSTSASTTLGFNFANVIGIPTMAATNASVIYTTPATLAILGPPVAGTNVTLTNPLSLYVDAGQSVFKGGFSSSANGVTSNAWFAGSTGMGSTTSAGYLFSAATTVNLRAGFGGNTSTSITSGNSAANVIFASTPFTTAASSTTAMGANVVINPLGTVTLGGSATLTTTASLLVNGASSAGTTNYAIYVPSGNVNFAGNATVGGSSTLAAVTANSVVLNGSGANNLYIGTSNGVTHQTNAVFLFAGLSAVSTRTVISGTSSTITAADGYASLLIGPVPVTVPTGTSTWVTNFAVATPNITSTGTTTNAATAYFGAAPTVGTNNYTAYFDIGGIGIKEGSNGRVGQTTLVAGTKAITITGLTTSSRAFPSFVSIGGTVSTTWEYTFVCTANTLTITAVTNSGATNTLDTSTLNYFVIN